MLVPPLPELSQAVLEPIDLPGGLVEEGQEKEGAPRHSELPLELLDAAHAVAALAQADELDEVALSLPHPRAPRFDVPRSRSA